MEHIKESKKEERERAIQEAKGAEELKMWGPRSDCCGALRGSHTIYLASKQDGKFILRPIFRAQRCGTCLWAVGSIQILLPDTPGLSKAWVERFCKAPFKYTARGDISVIYSPDTVYQHGDFLGTGMSGMTNWDKRVYREIGEAVSRASIVEKDYDKNIKEAP